MEIQINATTPAEISIVDPLTGIIGSIIVPIISTIVIALIGVYTMKYNKKQHDRSAIIDLFEMLNNSDHKSAEYQIMEGFRNHNLYDGRQIAFPFKEYAKIVWRNYDQVGLLIERKLIPENDFYSTFGKVTVISYFALSNAIENERMMGHRHFMARFTNLAIDCLEYWEKKKSLPINPLTNDDIYRENLGERVEI
jgi:hypothetical protein